MSSVLSKSFLEKYKESLQKVLEQYESISKAFADNPEYQTIDFGESVGMLKSEIEAIDTILAIPEENYKGLYLSESDDLCLLAQELSAKESQLIDDTKGIEDALTDSLEPMQEAVDILKEIAEDPEKNWETIKKEAEKQGIKIIAENPVSFVLKESGSVVVNGIKDIINGIKENISIASQARQACFEKDIEYKTYKQKISDAVKTMGNSAYRGIVSPIRQVTLDTMSDIMDKISSSYKRTLVKFGELCGNRHAIKSLIRGNELAHLGEVSYNKDYYFNKYDKKLNKLNDLKTAHPNSIFIQAYVNKSMQSLTELKEYINTDLENDVWKGKSPYRVLHETVDSIKAKTSDGITIAKEKIVGIAKSIKTGVVNTSEKAVNAVIRLQNKAMEFISETLVESANLAVNISKRIDIRALKYEKAASELGKVEVNLNKELASLLSTESYQPKQFNPMETPKNAEIAKQLEALKTMYPDDKIIKPLLKSYEKALKKEEKRFKREEAAIAKTDKKMIQQAIKINNKDYKFTSNVHGKVGTIQTLLESNSGVFKKLTALAMKASNIAMESKLKEVHFDKDKVKEDKDVQMNKDNIDLS